MRKLYILLGLLLLPYITFGQCVGNCTSVTTTLRDTNSQLWSNALITAVIVPPFGNPSPLLNNGVPVHDPINNTQANSSGVFTLSLDNNVLVTPANSQWKLIICPNATVPNCTITLVTVFGSTMDLSTQINPILVIPSINIPPTVYRAYNDTEVNGSQGGIYIRTVDNTFRSCVAALCNGTNWISLNINGLPVTFSQLSSCTSSIEGSQVPITDSTVNTWGTAITIGGGSTHVLAYCDGSNWTVMAK